MFNTIVDSKNSRISSYFVSGHAFTHNAISIRLFQTRPASSPPRYPEAFPLLDPSGSYILQASLRVQDGSKPELMSRGFAELVEFQKMLKGVVELSPGDRLAMDPRVR